MPVQSHVVDIVAEDDVAEVIQTVKRSIRRARLVLASSTVRRGPVRDVQSLLEQSQRLLLQCDLQHIAAPEKNALFTALTQLLAQAREELEAPAHVNFRAQVHPPRGRGRPSIVVELDRVLQLRRLGNLWSDIARTIGCSRQTLWNKLRGLADDQFPRGLDRPPISDDELDALVRNIKRGHAFIGSGIVKGHLQATDVKVSLKRVKASLLRVDPLGVARRRHRSIRRRVYKVRGSNFLWHMDQNEKLQPWGFMLHGCVDGHSRLHLWAECRTNKRATTVLRIAFPAFGKYGVPVRIRADRGTENNAVETFMIEYRGAANSPFIRGRSVQNVRIERLWGDVRKDSTEQFRVLFTSMETDGILKMHLRSHRLCLVLTFMDRIQTVLDRSRHAWNNHQLRTERYRTPLALYALSREELINSGNWPGDGTRPDADVGEDRGVFDGDYAWAQGVMGGYDFGAEDGMSGVRVFTEAVHLLEQLVPNVNDEN